MKTCEWLAQEEHFGSKKSNWKPRPTMSPGTDWNQQSGFEAISQAQSAPIHSRIQLLLTESEREGNLLASYTLSVKGAGTHLWHSSEDS